jgi:hypothetical protein
MSIAAFVDVAEDQRDLAVELTVAMAEFSVAEVQPLYLLADALTALEVGINLLGSRDSRTVEGGSYRVSPIQLLPFIPRPGWRDDEALREQSDGESDGDISEMYDLGLFARPQERDDRKDLGDDPARALSRVIERVQPRHVVCLGKTSEYWKVVDSTLSRQRNSYKPRIVTIQGLSSEPERSTDSYETVIVRPAEIREAIRPREDAPREIELDEFQALRGAAAREGAAVAAFIEFLIDSSRRR